VDPAEQLISLIWFEFEITAVNPAAPHGLAAAHSPPGAPALLHSASFESEGCVPRVRSNFSRSG
jgi:hypothetical protein